MSADNWALCPRCNKDQVNKLRLMKVNLEESYGKVDLKEYKLLEQEFYNTKKEVLEYTLREDYEQGMNKSGIYHISYSCQCTVCGFEYNYAYSYKVDIS